MHVTDDNGYPGGKGVSGLAEWILSQLPSHQLFVEPFAGKAAVTRAKSPALRTVLVEQSADVVEWLRREIPTAVVRSGCGIELLQNLGHWPGGIVAGMYGRRSSDPQLQASIVNPMEEVLWGLPWWDPDWLASNCLVYADPPYLQETRTKKAIYEFEWSDDQHRQFLDVVKSVPCPVAISGYPNDLYTEQLQGWTQTKTQAQTRGGLRTEVLYRNPLCVAAAAAAPARMAREYSELGDNWRERDRVSRLVKRWVRRFGERPSREQDAILRGLLDRKAGN